MIGKRVALEQIAAEMKSLTRILQEQRRIYICSIVFDNAFQEDAEKCIAVGMNTHLAKPLDIEKMKNTIKDICP
ncbi:MAG: hypothetical protein ACLTDV_08945 [Eubacterium sp.]